jgi:8-amino-7-oxononanoate synthase
VGGDLAPLAALHRAARAYGALLVVDEAHALGVVGTGGRGAAHDAGLGGAPDLVRTVTLSKSLGAQGGAVLGHPDVIAHLVDTARAFIFDTGLAPAAAGAALAALRVLRAEPDLADRVRGNAAALAAAAARHGLGNTAPPGSGWPSTAAPPGRHPAPPGPGRPSAAAWPGSGRPPVAAPDRPPAAPSADWPPAAAPLRSGWPSAVVPVVLGEPGRAVRAAQLCASHGLRVGCFRPPSVQPGGSCLRLTARADLTAADLARVDAAFAAVAPQL